MGYGGVSPPVPPKRTGMVLEPAAGTAALRCPERVRPGRCNVQIFKPTWICLSYRRKCFFVFLLASLSAFPRRFEMITLQRPRTDALRKPPGARH